MKNIPLLPVSCVFALLALAVRYLGSSLKLLAYLHRRARLLKTNHLKLKKLITNQSTYHLFLCISQSSSEIKHSTTAPTAILPTNICVRSHHVALCSTGTGTGIESARRIDLYIVSVFTLTLSRHLYTFFVLYIVSPTA